MNVPFCSCGDLSCSNHPGNHSDGCTRCIEKNLRQREVPACFFHLLSGTPTDYSFSDFARLVLEETAKNAAE